LLLTDLIEDTISGICVLSVFDINSDSELTYFDVFTLANSIILD